ncbi:MAG: ATP-binding protein [Aliarcobacter butzleri]|nr:ATP-binding protein [Aliarcobacter butzleri]
MIHNIKINNFKGLNSFTVKNLSKLTIIGGKNNCSKTSILEALFMLFNMNDFTVLHKIYNYRGINLIPIDIKYTFNSFFYDFNLEKKVNININSNLKGYQEEGIALSFEKNYIRKMSNIQMNTNISTEALKVEYLRGSSSFGEMYITVAQQQGFNIEIKKPIDINKKSVMFFPARIASNYEENSERFGRLELKNSTDGIIEILKIFVPTLKSLATIKIGPTSMIYADIGKNEKVPLSSMGDGITRLFSIILAIATNEDGIILIDEIENGLHYSVIKEVWKGIAKASEDFNCQVICTTHSHEFLSYVNETIKENNISDFSYIRLDRKDNEIFGKHFTKELLSLALFNDMEIR